MMGSPLVALWASTLLAGLGSGPQPPAQIVEPRSGRAFHRVEILDSEGPQQGGKSGFPRLSQPGTYGLRKVNGLDRRRSGHRHG